MRGWLKLMLLAAAVFTGVSCSVTKRVPQGEYLLRKNDIKSDRQTPRKERIKASEMERYVRQTPNKKLLGTDFYLYTYNAADPDKDNGWNRTLRRIGEEPVLLDTMLVSRSALNIRNYMHSRGFLNAEETYRIDTAKKKASVTYSVSQGTPYRIGDISYEFRDRFLEPLIMEESASTLLKTGNILDFTVLDAERARITEYLKDIGYYNFSVNNIYFVADTTKGEHLADLKMVVRQFQTGYDDRGEPVYENNPVYRISDINIYPEFDPTVAAIDSLYRGGFDTLEYRGLNIIYKDRPRLRSSILRNSISLYPNYLYSASDVKRTYDNLMRLGYYRSASINFLPSADTTRNVITFVGSAERQQEGPAESTYENYLTCNIFGTPALRQGYKIELEGSTTSSFYSITATVGYQNRNLFRGAELFDISVTGGYEFMRAKGLKPSFEIGGATSLTFPRFIAPFHLDRSEKIYNARTRIELSINSQRRTYYHRTLSSAVWGYNWSSARYSSFALRPIDLSLVKMGFVDEGFLNSLYNPDDPNDPNSSNNPYLRNSYTSQLIAGISGGYVFNNQRTNIEGNSLVIRFNWETAGNLIHGFSSMLTSSDREYYELFGIRYAQYFRADASISNKFMLGPRSSIVYRLYGGVGIAYGNSQSLPFDRLFYAGGSNSMRGWQVRTLGPGGVLSPENTRFPSQLGNMKLEANLEARFPVWGFLHGALFFDAGNIWFMKKGQGEEKGIFHANSFLKQLGFNTGLGARFDFNFFLLRLDWGIRIHDPNKPHGSRWRGFRVSDSTLSFGVGYPF